MSRDGFSISIKRELAQRVCNRCSNPVCRQPTSGPRLDSDKSANIGVAAHIKAASEGGPRFDPDQSAKERAGIENGIWLCQNCAKLVDSDVERYSSDLLHDWKNQAENSAHLALQQRSRSEGELDTFCQLAQKMPSLIEEMSHDLHSSEAELILEFVVLPSEGVWYQSRRNRFTYYETIHPFVQNAVQLLEEYGFVRDVTPKSYPVYRMTEEFVDLVTTLYPLNNST